MLDLGKIRNEIDITDSQILELFERRMALTEEVAQFKIETGKPVFDQQREITKLQKLGDAASCEFPGNTGDFPADHVHQPEAAVSASDRKSCGAGSGLCPGR